MKMPSGCSRILIAAAIMGCSGMALAAPEPAPSAGQLPPPCPERLAPPPAQPPLYALSQQTTTPAETLSAAVKNLPDLEKAKKYEVRVEVREITPPPPAQPPLYALSQQTTTPAETLSAAVKNIPALEKAKKYEVRVEVREITPPPPAPDMDDPRP